MSYENNWTPTAGKVPYFMFRFYGNSSLSAG